jgi:O-antigen/teichoic acid export membrane protein
LATSILVLGGGSFLISFLVLYLTNLVDLKADFKLLILLMFFYVLMNLIIEGFLLLKRNEEDLKRFAFIRLFKSFFEILITVTLVYIYSDFRLRIYAMVVASLMTTLIVLYMVYKTPSIKLEYDKKIVTKIFVYSAPLIFHTFFASILNYSDRYFINSFLGVSELGQYSVIYQLCMVMSLMINSFNMAWTPYFMKNMTHNSLKFTLTVNKLFKYYGIFLLVFAILLYLAIPTIYEFYVGIDYLVDGSVYGALLAAYFFNGLYRFKVSHLFYREKTISVAKLSMLTAIINLILNYICIDAWGILGAAVSTMASYFFLYLFLEAELFTIKRNERTS